MRHLAVLVLIFLMTSCASSRRLGRFFDEKALSSDKEAERTNLFPLFYNSGTSTSVLWPVFDQDEHGFSLRPFYNKEDNEYALLFPLSAWNPVAGDGWVGPLVWDKDFHAVFPLYYKSQNSFQFFTYYNFTQNSGLFPLYHKSKDSISVGGLYKWQKTEHGSKHKFMWSLMAHWEDENNGDYLHYAFPWLSYQQGGSNASMLVPLYYSETNEIGVNHNTILPFYHYSENTKTGDSSFHSLLGGYSRVGNKRNKYITPFWWSGNSPGAHYQMLFPFYYQGQNKNSKSTYLFPWYSQSDRLGSRQIIFPLYLGSDKGDDSFAMTPLSYYRKNSRGRRFHLFPIFSATEKLNTDGDFVEKSWQFPMLIPLIGNTTKTNSSQSSALFGLLYSNEEKSGKTNGSILGIMAGWEKDDKSKRFRIPALFNMSGLIDLSEDENSSKVNIFFYSHEKTKTNTRRDIFPFITWDSGKDESSFSFLWRVFETHENNGKSGGHFFFIPWGE
ncbi:MAG: hypothetical protein HRT88_08750 [Lentisphaeraceae bacterium]|nr:hypothetical protein [Lentisphaeraceae bacterium]